MKSLWTESHRPKSIDQYVFQDPQQRRQIESWIKAGALPNMLLSGSPGVGKTTLARVLLNELGVNKFDILEVNASKDNGVDFIRDTITRFAETGGYGDIRYVLLDESDYLSANSQAVLRNTLEKYADTVRFIFTCNYPHKIIPAIQSRTETGRMSIDRLDRDEFTLRLCNILIEEKIEFEMELVDMMVTNTYPDMRRAISMLQANSLDGKLNPPRSGATTVADFRTDMVGLFREGRFREARTLICSQIKSEEYEDLYRFFYQNLDIWADSPGKQDRCILEIKQGLVDHTICADSEINLSATLIRLEMIAMDV